MTCASPRSRRKAAAMDASDGESVCTAWSGTNDATTDRSVNGPWHSYAHVQTLLQSL